MTCAHAVRVAVEKLPGVEKVEVGLNRGTVNITLRPENRVTLAGLWDLIKKQGHVIRKVHVQARARVVNSGRFKDLEILGTNETLHLDLPKMLPEESIGKAQRVTAEALVPKDSLRWPPLQLVEAKPEP